MRIMQQIGNTAGITTRAAFSGRLTAPLVFAGAIAKQLLREHGIRVFSHVLRIGNISDLRFEPCMCEQPMLDPFFPLVAPNRRSAFEELFEKAAAGKTSLGGIVECAALLEPGIFRRTVL